MAALLTIACAPPEEEDSSIGEERASAGPDSGGEEVPLSPDVAPAAGAVTPSRTFAARPPGASRTRDLGRAWSARSLPDKAEDRAALPAVPALGVDGVIGAGPGGPAPAPRTRPRWPVSHLNLLSRRWLDREAAADQITMMGGDLIEAAGISERGCRAPVTCLRATPRTWRDEGPVFGYPVVSRYAISADGVFAFVKGPQAHDFVLGAHEPCTWQPRWEREFGLHREGLAVVAVGTQVLAAIGEVVRVNPPGYEVGEYWWLERLDAHTGALLGSTPRIEGWLGPVTAGGDLLVVSSFKESTAQLADGVSILPSEGPTLRAYATTGLNPLWQRALDVTRVAVGAHGPVVAFGKDGAFHVLDRETGRTLLHLPEEPYTTVAEVALVDERGFFFIADGAVAAIDLRGGGRRWEREIPGLKQQLLLAADALYVATDDEFVEALDLESGATLWSWSIGRPFQMDLPAVVDTAELVIADAEGAVWTFGRGPRPAPLETVVIEGRVRHSSGKFPLVIGGERVELDRRGRFRAVVQARGSTFKVSAHPEPFEYLLLWPAGTDDVRAESVAVEVGGGRRKTLVLDFASAGHGEEGEICSGP